VVDSTSICCRIYIVNRHLIKDKGIYPFLLEILGCWEAKVLSSKVRLSEGIKWRGRDDEDDDATGTCVNDHARVTIPVGSSSSSDWSEWRPVAHPNGWNGSASAAELCMMSPQCCHFFYSCFWVLFCFVVSFFSFYKKYTVCPLIRLLPIVISAMVVCADLTKKMLVQRRRAEKSVETNGVKRPRKHAVETTPMVGGRRAK